VNAEGDYVEIVFSEDPDEAQTLLNSVKNFTRRSSFSNISLVVIDRDGFSLKDIKNKKPKLQLDKNYNDDLIPLHDNLVRTLKTENSSGLVLFHGVPGTGKSTYIRFITSYVKKKIIFLSPRMAAKLDDPNFAKLLIENPNSVIIIEDAEDLLISRDTDKNSGISMLLNLTDGLLGTTLGIQFICTFNTPVTNIDKALLRKGRLIALYEFGPLSPEKSKALLNDLGTQDFMVTQPMTLADIYNVSKPAFQLEAKRNPIGFNTYVA
jgi:SpoVK/Ycf46/Vps4 family AAA+-type ATPase